MIACTVIAKNYLAHARVLAKSFAAHHSGRRLAVLVIDFDEGRDNFSDEPFDLVTPSELPLGDDFHVMTQIYSALELATAVKPSLLRLLQQRTAQPVVYVDPDVEIFAPLDSADEFATTNGIVLVPHLRVPVPMDGRRPTEREIAEAGVFNLGFIAVGDGDAPFLEWWDTRMRRDCVVSIEDGLFVDQRIIDFVPVLFDHHVLRDPTYNVAYWNLHERRLEWTGCAYEVEGKPLTFFHFSGFDPERPGVLSRHQGTKARRYDSEVAIRRICGQYAARLHREGYREIIKTPYGYGQWNDGRAVDARVRRAYRHALLATAPSSFKMPSGSGTPDLPTRYDDWRDRVERTAAALPPLERARLHLLAGPDLGADSRIAAFARALASRLFRPYLQHQEQTLGAFLEAVEKIARERPTAFAGREEASDAHSEPPSSPNGVA